MILSRVLGTLLEDLAAMSLSIGNALEVDSARAARVTAGCIVLGCFGEVLGV